MTASAARIVRGASSFVIGRGPFVGTWRGGYSAREDLRKERTIPTMTTGPDDEEVAHR
jgi:hypothetical protein